MCGAGEGGYKGVVRGMFLCCGELRAIVLDCPPASGQVSESVRPIPGPAGLCH